ncbi:helix-turn-helix domain-containing protein [Streptacidiphilus albus]|uniref:helix-turn-helix domain-containing protein n=1 Tax=Streptacidiphilus albus TaxID=105425 RepID=UPI00054C25C7|nr:helix-turn-helix transcriptional regulator [Streptacidiphilus albus]
MPSSPLSSVNTARAALAERLKELRLDADLNGRELAARCGWSAAKVSRIENGKTPPSSADIRDWCRECGAQGKAEDLIAAARSVGSMYTQWLREHRTGMRHKQDLILQGYERTRTFRIYCSNVIPGIFQTPEYARALMTMITRFQGTPDDVEDAVVARVARGRLLREGDRRFAVLLEEAVLRHRLGDAEVMAGQLGYLLSVMSLPSVSLGIIPSGAVREMWPLEAFYLCDERDLEVETLTAEINVTAPGELADYARAFGELAKSAVHGSAARSLITSAIDALG